METTQDHETALAANDLYWGSDRSVNQIAEDLDLSKGALYGLIRPLPAGLGCPECAQEVVFPNRTARDRGLLACASCGWEGGADDATSYATDGAVTLPTYEMDSVPPPPASVSAVRNRTIVGGALLGAAAGLALVIWARRR